MRIHTMTATVTPGDSIEVVPPRPFSDAAELGLPPDSMLPWRVGIASQLGLWFDDPADVRRLRDALDAALRESEPGA